MTKFNWYPQQLSEEEATHFSTWERCNSLQGELISRSLMSSLTMIKVASRNYYVKKYEFAGRHLRRLVGRTRVRAEWENLQYFQSLGIPTARVVAYGEQSFPHFSRQGMLVTEEIPDCHDLASLAEKNKKLFADKVWLERVFNRLADHVSKLHHSGFCHGDLKWRNILVGDSESPEVYLIDCPIGRKYPGFLRERGIIKDLACLDKVAKYILSGSDRRSFYLKYANKMELDLRDERRISKVLRFFDGRE